MLHETLCSSEQQRGILLSSTGTHSKAEPPSTGLQLCQHGLEPHFIFRASAYISVYMMCGWKLPGHVPPHQALKREGSSVLGPSEEGRYLPPARTHYLRHLRTVKSTPGSPSPQQRLPIAQPGLHPYADSWFQACHRHWRTIMILQ